MTTLGRMRSGRRAGRGLKAAIALFCVRAVVPLGYMPASIADGGPFVLCPGTSTPTLAMLDAHDSMHHAGHAGELARAPAHSGMHADGSAAAGGPPGGHHALWEHCPLGIGTGDAALGSAFDPPVVEAAPAAYHAADRAVPAFETFAHFRARAPPA